MLVMGDGTESVQRDAHPEVIEAVRAQAGRSRGVGWAKHYGAGAVLAVCGGQLALFYAGSALGGVFGAVVGGLLGGLAMRWIGAHRKAPNRFDAPYEVSMRALEEAQRTQLEVLERLRQISASTAAQEAARN